jgi:adenylosuccinate lyase
MPIRDIFDSVSPIDYRYWDERFAKYLSENAFTRYKLMVEFALVKILSRRGLCARKTVDEVENACKAITAAEVDEEEKKTRHDIRALVNCMQRKVSPESRPFVHMTATSYDIIDSANAMRFRDAVNYMVMPALRGLLVVLIDITTREASTVQIGRTHGQHAVPITFGFAMAGYVNRLGNCIQSLKECTQDLRGKFSGAVGAFNASSLFFSDPEAFEAEVLAELGLQPALHSTQIVPPEPMIRLMSEAALTAGVMGNLARDMRNLQRTEIAEVGEEFEEKQVGSSTMPQKRNPIGFENAESIWKVIIGRMFTVYMDQLSDHQRDLTNSASSRTYGEMLCYLTYTADRLAKVMKKLRVDKTNMERNLDMQGGLILAEPLYIILAALGHPDAHEKVRTLTLRSQKEGKPLQTLAKEDQELEPYFARMNARQQEVLKDPRLYTGIAQPKAKEVAECWKQVCMQHVFFNS